MMMKRIAAAIFAATLLTGCASFIEGFKKGYNEAFAEDWKKGFVQACVGDNKTEEQLRVCNCAADRAVQEMTVDQLRDASYAANYIAEKILPHCQTQENQ